LQGKIKIPEKNQKSKNVNFVTSKKFKNLNFTQNSVLGKKWIFNKQIFVQKVESRRITVIIGQIFVRNRKILAKNRKFVKTIETLIKNWKFVKMIEILVKNRDFAKK